MKATYDMMPDYEPPSKNFNSYLAAIYIKKLKNYSYGFILNVCIISLDKLLFWEENLLRPEEPRPE